MERIEVTEPIKVKMLSPDGVIRLTAEYREILENELRIINKGIEEAMKCNIRDDLSDLDFSFDSHLLRW